MGGIGLNYDDDGNLTNDGTLTYTYDAENRMIAATPRYPVTGSKKLEAGYDYQGRRVSKRVYTYNAGIWTLERTKTATYDGWNMVKEQTTTGSTTTTEYYVWGLDLSGSLQGAGGIGGLLLWNKASGTFVYLYDANGNVGQLVNAMNGAIAARYEYDPFGNTLVADGPEATNNPSRFSTKYFDVETGLYYYGYRYYSPVLGRWTTRDPIEELGFEFILKGAISDVHWAVKNRFGIQNNFSYNQQNSLYVFVFNNPINRIDLWGLLVDAVFERSSGILIVTDRDTGENIWAFAESGGHPTGDPIPLGSYDILDQAQKPNFFRLDALDQKPDNDIHEPTGRSAFRLHGRGRGRTLGCIAVQDERLWAEIKRLIDSTTTTSVIDHSVPFWKCWARKIIKYGDLHVIMIAPWYFPT